MMLDRALDKLARTYPGPGGACAVIKGGEVLVRHAWGWANAERRIRFTPRTLFRVCSITKQFTCGVLLDAFPEPSVLDAAVRARLPLLEQNPPGALQLCHNQSGLRDYWAVAMLHGSPVEAPFGESEAIRVIAGTRSLQFAPGSRYSYANQNFRLLADVVEERSGRSFSELLRRSIFDRAGMADALLAADTRTLPDGTEGYEGTPALGYRAAVNRVLWTGDAGVAATLDDMIAWECHIDATREDPNGLYRGLSAPVRFADGAAAEYGFGLSRRTELGRQVSGHGGALRGWRSHRLYAPAERVSIVVLFNHLADAHAAAVDLLAAVLGVERPARDPAFAASDWVGAYLEPETGLAARIDGTPDGQLRLRFGHSAERLELFADGSAANESTTLRSGAEGLRMERRAENLHSLLRRCDPARQGAAAGAAGGTADVAGRYRCAELDAELTVVDAGGVLYGGFSGFLGQGRMEMLEPIGADVWALPCPRALDHTPPGDWTLSFERDAARQVRSAEVGCWLARGLRYARLA